MKKMTCSELGGACDLAFYAINFDEIAQKAREHGMEMVQKNDQPHIDAMQNMQALMASPGAMQEWFENKRKEFNNRPDSE